MLQCTVTNLNKPGYCLTEVQQEVADEVYLELSASLPRLHQVQHAGPL